MEVFFQGNPVFSGKGITNIITTILMLSLVISLITMTYFWFSGMQESVGEETEAQVESVMTDIHMEVEIDNANNRTVYVRNTGSVEIPNNTIGLYINGTFTPFTLSSSIGVGKVGSLRISDLGGGKYYTFRVSAGGSSDSAYIYIE